MHLPNFTHTTVLALSLFHCSYHLVNILVDVLVGVLVDILVDALILAVALIISVAVATVAAAKLPMYLSVSSSMLHTYWSVPFQGP